MLVDMLRLGPLLFSHDYLWLALHLLALASKSVSVNNLNGLICCVYFLCCLIYPWLLDYIQMSVDNFPLTAVQDYVR